MKIGQKVKSNTVFAGVPKGTEGYVIDDYGTGITIGWDLPNQPYPKHLSEEQVRDMWAIDLQCPLRDGFDKKTELKYLDKI